MSTTSKEKSLLLEDEVLRDGLQIESLVLTLSEKMELFELLLKAGLKRIQIGSFVHPGIVPQMADTDELIKAIGPRTATTITALVLNGKGLDRALASGIAHVSMSVSVSDSHSRKNANRPATEALSAMLELIGNAIGQGLEVRTGLQSAFGCVYEGAIAEHRVLAAAEQLAAAGAKEINLADSTGMANPLAVRSMVALLSRKLPGIDISLHLHDTRGLGIANMFAGYEAGVRIFDVCTGGLGGCPFIKGAAGNVPTEDAVHLFESLGVETGISLAKLIEAVNFLEQTLGRPLPGKMKRVFDYRNSCAA
ncbi:MAG: hydroxymethylglutaryl-CoA lyase [Desulfofustis sp.]|nr:hydroxymethylglutaryl-CoA lyase [Desulfofustis sp.]